MLIYYLISYLLLSYFLIAVVCIFFILVISIVTSRLEDFFIADAKVCINLLKET